MDAKRLGCRENGKRHPNWEQLYQSQPVEQLPWHFAKLDPDLNAELRARDLSAGSFLDIGTGAGTQARELQEMGFTVTGTDLSPTAILEAKKASGVAANFLVDDILDSKLVGSFDFIFDRGCLHVLEPQQRAKYASAVARLTKPGGLVFLKCFSDEEPSREFGPHLFSRLHIHGVFRAHFSVKTIRRTVFQGSTATPPKALFTVLQR